MFTRSCEKQGEGGEAEEGKEEGCCGKNWGTEDWKKEGKMKR